MFLDNNRLVFKVSGADRFKFLQGLITQDISRLESGDVPVIYTALLSPNGRYQFDFFIATATDEALWVVAANADALLSKIKPYKLRLAVEFEVCFETLQVYGSFTPLAEEGMFCFKDPRHFELPYWVIAEKGLAVHEDYTDYLDCRFGLGVPETQDFEYDRSIILEWGLEQLNGISFTKGCYMGQELMSRTKHVGQVRKRIFPCQFDDVHGPITIGDDVMFQGNKVGEVKAVHKDLALVLLRTESLPLQLSTVPVLVGNEKAIVYKPDWIQL